LLHFLTMSLASCALLLLLQVSKADDAGEKAKLLHEAKRIGDEFLALEKYVNLNYLVGGSAGELRVHRPGPTAGQHGRHT
jgi:hypothetical protein